MYECPNCGGNLKYDIASAQMMCAACQSAFDPYQVRERSTAQEYTEEYTAQENWQDGANEIGDAQTPGGGRQDADALESGTHAEMDGSANGTGVGGNAADGAAGVAGDAADGAAYGSTAQDGDRYTVTVFTCPQCGGEIYSTDQTAAGFCTFCGSAAVLESRLRQERRPEYIIPFGKTKEECKKAYMRRMRRAIFAPKELKQEKYIREFRGIYMPYWIYDVHHGGGSVVLNGGQSHRRGDYIVTKHYRFQIELDASYEGLAYDASSSFSDTLSEAIAPFDVKSVKAFTPAFLSGFYADTSDVDASLYREDAEAFALERTETYLRGQTALAGCSMEETGRTLQKQLHSRVEKTHGAMFPVWFMAYKKGERVAYAAINGQTGKVAVDLPVDTRKYFGGACVLAVPFFLLLNLFFTVTSRTLLAVLMGMAVVVAWIYHRQVDALVAKENGEDDKGALVVKKSRRQERTQPGQSRKKRLQKAFGAENSAASETDADMALAASAEIEQQNVKASGKKKKHSGLLTTVIVVAICLLINAVVIDSALLADFFTMKTVIAVCALLILGLDWSANRRLQEVPGQAKKAQTRWLFLAGILCTALVFVNPVSDIYYYSAAICILAAEGVALWDLIRCYNVFATRPLPQFHYKGGDDRA